MSDEYYIQFPSYSICCFRLIQNQSKTHPENPTITVVFFNHLPSSDPVQLFDPTVYLYFFIDETTRFLHWFNEFLDFFNATFGVIYFFYQPTQETKQINWSQDSSR
jgi:hypothetical protein